MASALALQDGLEARIVRRCERPARLVMPKAVKRARGKLRLRAEEFRVRDVGAGIAALDVVDAQLVQRRWRSAACPRARSRRPSSARRRAASCRTGRGVRLLMTLCLSAASGRCRGRDAGRRRSRRSRRRPCSASLSGRPGRCARSSAQGTRTSAPAARSAAPRRIVERADRHFGAAGIDERQRRSAVAAEPALHLVGAAEHLRRAPRPREAERA